MHLKILKNQERRVTKTINTFFLYFCLVFIFNVNKINVIRKKLKTFNLFQFLKTFKPLYYTSYRFAEKEIENCFRITKKKK